MMPAVAIVEQYPVLLDDINKMIVEYQALSVVAGDTASYKEARAACTTLVHTRTAIEAKRKELLRDYRDNVNQVADALLAPLTPVEIRLKAELKAEDDRKAAIKAELEAIEKKRIDAIKAAVFKLVNYANAMGKTADEIRKRIAVIEAHEISAEKYQEFAAEAQLAKTTTLKSLREALVERERIEREEADRKAEAERLVVVRAQQYAEQKRFDAEIAAHAEELRQARLKVETEEKRLAEERRKIEAEKAAIEAAKQKTETEEVGPPATQTPPDVKPSSQLITDRESLISYFNVIQNINRPTPQTAFFADLLATFLNQLNQCKKIALEKK